VTGRIGVRLAKGLAVLAAASIGVLAGMIVLGTAKAPPPMRSITEPFTRIDYSDLPPLERYTARDGVVLSFREYQPAGNPNTEPAQVAVLIHGSAGSSLDMHLLAKTLADAGILVYVPDVRGHGANRPHGDIRYVGQLDDDLVDFVGQKRPLRPKALWTLVGFSSGGGFALRFDGGPNGGLFDRYLLLSPYMTSRAPVARVGSDNKAAGGPDRHPQAWSAPYVGRIIGISILDGFHIHWFDGLAVLAFATPPDVPGLTSKYSMRMLENFGAGRPWTDDYLRYIRNIRRPTAVMIGGSDELMVPDRVVAAFRSQREDVPVTIVPGLGHIDMITNPTALQAVREWFTGAPEGPENRMR
jgi:non-heme chloroperoxidase